jgi:5-methylcytosine-specific restriction endonuclease McrA
MALYWHTTKERITITVDDYDSLSVRTQDWLSKKCRREQSAQQSFFYAPYELWQELEEVNLREKKNTNGKKSRKLRNQKMCRAGGAYKQSDVDRIFKIQNGRCYYCKAELKAKPAYEVDHIIPLADNGTNWVSNLALTCKKCNSAKGAMSKKAFWAKARKMYGHEVIFNSQKENKSQSPAKEEHSSKREEDFFNQYFFENSGFWELRKILNENAAQSTGMFSCELRNIIFGTITVIEELILKNNFKKSRSKLKEIEKLQFLTAQFLIVESIYRFLAVSHAGNKDFFKRFELDDLCEDLINIFPLSEIYVQPLHSELYAKAFNVSENECAEISVFKTALISYLNRGSAPCINEMLDSFENLCKIMK